MSPNLEFSRQATAERLIAGGRAALAAVAMAVIWADPTEPASYAALAYALSVAYLAYAVTLAAMTWAGGAWLPHLGLFSHAIDLPVFVAFLYLTEGPGSPFFAFFVFAVLAATLRWQWRGTLWTTGLLLLAFIGITLYLDLVRHDPSFDLNFFMIRSAYLVVVAVLVGYISAFEERLRAEIAALAAWRRGRGEEDDVLRGSLEQAAAICRAPRLLLVWEQSEEPWRHLALLSRDGLRRLREAPGEAEPIVAAALHGRAFLCNDCAAARPSVLHGRGTGLTRWRGAPLAAALRARFAIRAVLAVPLAGAEVTGWLFALDPRRATPEDLDLLDVVARQVTAELDQLAARRGIAQTAALRERIRLGRNLHDGVLQALAGIGLQLGAIRRELAEAPALATERLERLEHMVTGEQRDLRFFIQGLGPVQIDPTCVGASLLGALSELARRIETHWGTAVAVTFDQADAPLPEALAQEAFRLVQEALANAARHGRATTASAVLALAADRLVITVTDNGGGFAFHGRYDLAALKAAGLGPVSLRERVAGLGGDLELDSTEAGVRVTMALPLRPAMPAGR